MYLTLSSVGRTFLACLFLLSHKSLSNLVDILVLAPDILPVFQYKKDIFGDANT